MAVFHPTRVTCKCGRAFVANLARSVNAKRMPAMRQRILSGKFHRVSCPVCGRRWAVESPFYYTDLARSCVFHVQPRNARYKFREDSGRLDTVAASLNGSADPPPRQLRVVYGLDELREKLVAQDAGLDDRIVELLKLLVLQQHPFLMGKPRLLIHLHAVRPSLDFIVYHHHGSEGFKISLPREAVSELLSEPDAAAGWVKRSGHKTDLFDLPDHWVNFRRWSTRYGSFQVLRRLTAQVEAGNPVGLRSKEFKDMLRRLPSGSQLPDWAKRDLARLFEYAKKKKDQRAQDTLFEVRFGIELENEWATNRSAQDIDTIWQLLEALPPSNVEGNTKIDRLQLEKGESDGWYANDVIAIGEREIRERESFEDVLRHEVGHGVHEQSEARINAWLRSRFGWRVFGTTAAEIDRWVGLMGGWRGLPEARRGEVRQYLRQALGPGDSWVAGEAPDPPPEHPWWGKTFGPRLAYENTGDEWYGQCQKWYRRGGRAFFLNYYYAQLMVVDAKTLDLVKKMPDAYAAMSHFEFFAELYALYYDLDDPKRKFIPRDVTKWLEENVGKPERA